MQDGATSLRDRRVAETSHALRTAARRLTIELGFTGFTIEELCAEVGVSRRTFFNYFASKENAAIGVPLRSDTSDLDEAFVSGTGSLLEDLAALQIARWERFSLTKAEADEVGRLFDREPRLFQHFLGLMHEGEREDVALVLRRTHQRLDELDAGTAVHLLGALMRPAVADYFHDESTDFRAFFLRRLEAAYRIFSL